VFTTQTQKFGEQTMSQSYTATGLPLAGF